VKRRTNWRRRETGKERGGEEEKGRKYRGRGEGSGEYGEQENSRGRERGEKEKVEISKKGNRMRSGRNEGDKRRERYWEE
jgi:hypothetical protein